MNLKEAFRFQNKLSAHIDSALDVLASDENVTKVKNTYLRKKVCAEAENETMEEQSPSEFADRVTDITRFLIFLMGEREKLFAAIRSAKNALEIDIDSEASLNGCRQSVARVLNHMVALRSSEVVLPNGGTGYRFNAEGNQVSYRCDVRKVTTINFDRDVVRREAEKLHAKADETSAEIDRCVVNTPVEYETPFNVNDSFTDVFEAFCEKQSA